ncbi:MAG TPA: hypothetical protein PKN32_07075 [Bacteroidales bacterium]|jgi:hypothetical protein|nr:hypothetical protein [Bacteroidales bacterium]
MKKLVAISGATGLSTAILCVLFKTMHFTGGSILLLISVVTLSLIFIPSYSKYWYDKNK